MLDKARVALAVAFCGGGFGLVWFYDEPSVQIRGLAGLIIGYSFLMKKD